MTTSTLKSPIRREYKPTGELIETPTSELPFANNETESLWDVPLTDDLEMAERIGTEYAGHYLQYLKDNPNIVGASLLGWIAKDIDFDSPLPNGYWIGFFSHLERVLYLQALEMDIFKGVDMVNAENDEFMDILREDGRLKNRDDD